MHDRKLGLGCAALALVFFVSLGVALDAHAQTGARVDASVIDALARGRPDVDPPGRATVLVELDDASSLSELGVMPGVTLVRAGGSVISWRTFVPASIDDVGLASLSRSRHVARVRLAPRAGRPPLDHTRALAGIDAAWTALPDRALGSGVVLGDLDTAIDVFHPAFFRADAGWFDWIDVDGDGRYSTGDAIDLNADGIPQPEETSGPLRAALIDPYGNDTALLRSGGFDPAIDWIYIDVDLDGVRAIGADYGYDDSAPGLGEPLFVPDDVDRDGRLDPEERVARLGSSKVRDYYVSTRDFSGGSAITTYTRGVDLSLVRRNYTGGVYGYADTLHGTGVAGILVADVPLIGRRYVGLAPEADLVVGADMDASPMDGLMWVLSQEPDVMVHEYVLWTGVALDGSDPQSALIDASADTVAHVCPAGNIGGVAKHTSVRLGVGETRELEFRNTTVSLYLSVHVPVGADVGLVLVEPPGIEHDFASGPTTLLTGERLEVEAEASDRTFEVRTFYFQRRASSPIEVAPWSLRVRGDPTAAVTIHAYLEDEQGFARSSAWTASSDDSTISWPATADGCIAVGAAAGHASGDGVWYRGAGVEPTGGVRGFSSRGPRIDGRHTIGVVAPDNPWSTLGAGELYPASPGALVAPEGAYMVFGGTSGAGPHVAGALAILAETGVHGRAALARISATATADARTGAVPNDDYGMGRLDAARALSAAPSAHDPDVVLSAVEVGGRVRVTPTVTDADGDEVVVRWDLGYDGSWDSDFAPAEARELDFTAGGLRLKVRARDASGRIDEAVLFVPTLESIRGDAGLTSADAGPSPPASGGCGCRVGGRSPAVAASMLSALGALAACQRWRSRKRTIAARAASPLGW